MTEPRTRTMAGAAFPVDLLTRTWVPHGRALRVRAAPPALGFRVTP